jgi:peptidyl-prolyl cis-trans isomerase SurA
MKGSVYMNLGDTKLSDLSPEIQKALASTHPGDVAMPFVSEAGVEIIARCDKRVVTTTAYVIPTRNQVEEQLFDQQISAFARRYLRDLKRDANIQVRDEHGTMQLASRIH